MSSSLPDPESDPSGLKPAAWYQVVLAAIGDAVLTTDPEGHITYINPVAESLTGWLAAEAHGRPLEDVCRIVNEETRKPTEQPVRKVIATGLIRGLANHTILIAKDGRELPIDDSAAPVWGEDGQLVGVVMIFRDMTERRQSEQLIEDAKGFAESIVGTVREPLLILDADLHVKSANRSFYETFRVEPPETENQFIYDLGDGQWNIPALKTLLEEIIPQNSVFDDFEVEHEFEIIGRRTMLLNARRFPPEGKWELILLAIADITERKRLEREREGLLRAAEEARARAETNEALLAEADRRKDEFIAILAHELRTPMGAISMAGQLSRDPKSEEDRNWSLGIIDRQVKNLNRLIEALLDVSRVANGKVNLQMELLDLRTVIGHAVEAVSALVEEREHELTISLPPDAMMVEADSTRLEQVFANLLTNAAKYTEKGGHIWLDAGVEREQFLVSVRDTGEGIAAEMLPRLFEMFTQVETSTRRSRGGLGIGLSLVKNLVEMHKGTVEVASKGIGRGSEFSVRLPRA
jgi:PAS domain S-box-containing protein